MLTLLVPLLTELILLLSVDTQGFISGFALIPPWAYAGVSCLKALVISLNFDALALLKVSAIRLCRLKSVSLHSLIEERQAVDTY